jgi:hypothetical protein
MLSRALLCLNYELFKKCERKEAQQYEKHYHIFLYYKYIFLK